MRRIGFGMRIPGKAHFSIHLWEPMLAGDGGSTGSRRRRTCRTVSG